MILAPPQLDNVVKKEISIEKSEKTTSESSSFQEIPHKEVKKSIRPIGTRTAPSEYSIKKHTEITEKETEQNLFSQTKENLPEHHFSETDLRTEWGNFLKDLSVNDIVAYNAVSSFQLHKTDENEIEIAYSSDSAKKEFEAVESDFLHHFQHKVNNFKVKIRYRLDLSQRKEVMTKRKLYDKLIEINPVLKDLEDLMKFDFS